jgi:hypothetical protein
MPKGMFDFAKNLGSNEFNVVSLIKHKQQGKLKEANYADLYINVI